MPYYKNTRSMTPISDAAWYFSKVKVQPDALGKKHPMKEEGKQKQTEMRQMSSN